jgi:hypothetical protein
MGIGQYSEDLAILIQKLVRPIIGKGYTTIMAEAPTVQVNRQSRQKWTLVK